MARNPEIVTIDPDLGSRAETKRAAQLGHFSVIGEAGYGVEAVTVAKEHTPDVFLVSFEEPVALALQTIAALADAVPNAPTIVYSSLADAGSVRRAMIAGAFGTASANAAMVCSANATGSSNETRKTSGVCSLATVTASTP